MSAGSDTAALRPAEPGALRSAGTPPTVTLLGVRIHTCTAYEAARQIASFLSGPAQHTVVPVNPEMVIAARGNGEFREAINAASLALPDGTGVLLASRLYQGAAIERIPGVDTVEEISAIAARSGLSLFLLGAAPGVAERAGRRLAERHGGLVIAGTYAGTPDPGEELAICERINASNADILFIAYGAPSQELWVGRNLRRLTVRLAMTVGGTFDFLAGVKARAPRWMRRAGLEWLFRLAQEPRRWRRMLALPKFAVLVTMERIRRRS